jgi:hypothetical protein
MLNEPPYELAPNTLPPLFVLLALQLEHAESVTVTDTSCTLVVPQALLLLLEVAPLKLQAYAPTCKTFIDPPYEFAPNDVADLTVVDALMSLEVELKIRTVIPLTLVVPHTLLLVPLEEIRLQA